ncbi:hypothetical protein ACFV4N_32755 [Actinosynnema sp. NPDC059797]
MHRQARDEPPVAQQRQPTGVVVADGEVILVVLHHGERAPVRGHPSAVARNSTSK